MTDPTVVVATWPGDQHQAIRLFKWIAELGMVQSQMLLIASDECDQGGLMAEAKKAFSVVRLEPDLEKIKCNWSDKDPGPKSAAGPNSLWKIAAWYFHMPTLKGPWFWLEPDAVPCRPDWFTVLAAEYKNAQKPFMGALCTDATGAHKHMSGMGFYDPRTPQIMTKAMRAEAGAFDTADAERVLENAHITTRMIDFYRPPAFGSMQEVNERVPDGTCMYHSNKDGSLIPFLRTKLGMKGGDATCIAQDTVGATYTRAAQNVPEVTLQGNGAVTFNPEAAPVVDIYLKTYPKDYELADYCWKSIAKFVTGYRNILVEVPDFVNFGYPSVAVQVVVCKDREPGYLDQQAKKLSAFRHTDADYLLYVDSDCCFQRPFDIGEMFKNGKPTWQYTPLTDAREDQKGAWVPVMEKFLGKTPPNEFMRRHPHIIPRWLPEEMDKFCRYRHGKTLDEYIMAQAVPGHPLALTFSEFNCAGFFAWEFFRDRFEWITDTEATPAPLFQGFTHGSKDLIKEHINKCRAILGENKSAEVEATETAQITLHEWQHIAPIETALAILSDEARKSPGHKGRLIRKFNSAMAAVKPKMPEGFGGGRRKKKEKPIAVVFDGQSPVMVDVPA